MLLTALTEQGDITVEWKPDDEDSVMQAREEWDALKRAGFEFFLPAKAGGKGRRVRTFNVDHGWVIAAPGVQTAQDRPPKPIAAPGRQSRGAPKRGKAMAGGPVDSRPPDYMLR